MEIMIIAFAALAVMMFFGVRKQKKALAEQQELQDSMSVGDRVMTTSGMYGTVADASDPTTIKLEIADGVVTEWLRQAVREKVGDIVPDDEADGDADGQSGESTDGTDADTTSHESTADQSAATVAPPLEHGGK